LQKRSDTFIDRILAGQQLVKIPCSMQLLLFVGHSGFHQQGGYTILQLHRLTHQEVPIAQRSPPLSDFGRGHVALRQKVAAQAVRELAGIDPIVLLLGGGRLPAASADALPSLLHAASDDRKSSR